ncbi:glycosyltransferase [Novosphingobium resinovorum]|uniref:glycosyltransferase n=1 Tax=Novosphingobium resinovorum TaxID=158500 RepID=UPI0009F2E536|nr:glycosyltransferase [Novosphingobium resinovorum]
MIDRPIGYYVHHHGAGHRARAQAIAAASERLIVLLGTGLGENGIDLADDRPLSGLFDGFDGASSRPDALHYAPLDHEGVRSRVARITGWIAQARPAMMVIDVSAEVAMLARLASVPTICVRLSGNRDDPAHLETFRAASGLLAPFHPACESAATPEWVRAKTLYLPGIAQAPAEAAPLEKVVLVVFGQGGPTGDGDKLAKAARAWPGWRWRVIGPAAVPPQPPGNLEFAGWVASPEAEIARAAVVIGAGGNGLVGAVMAADRPFVCIPEDRPYAEQHATGHGLKALGAAIVLPEWPSACFWGRILDDAVSMSGEGRRRLRDPMAAEKAAQWLAQHASRSLSLAAPGR